MSRSASGTDAQFAPVNVPTPIATAKIETSGDGIQSGPVSPQSNAFIMTLIEHLCLSIHYIYNHLIPMNANPACIYPTTTTRSNIAKSSIAYNILTLQIASPDPPLPASVLTNILSGRHRGFLFVISCHRVMPSRRIMVQMALLLSVMTMPQRVGKMPEEGTSQRASVTANLLMMVQMSLPLPVLVETERMLNHRITYAHVIQMGLLLPVTAVPASVPPRRWIAMQMILPLPVLVTPIQISVPASRSARANQRFMVQPCLLLLSVSLTGGRPITLQDGIDSMYAASRPVDEFHCKSEECNAHNKSGAIAVIEAALSTLDLPDLLDDEEMEVLTAVLQQRPHMNDTLGDAANETYGVMYKKGCNEQANMQSIKQALQDAVASHAPPLCGAAENNKLLSAPEVAVVLLDRYKVDRHKAGGTAVKKDTTPVTISPRIKLAVGDICIDYDVLSIVDHVGKGMGSGHCTAFVRRPNGSGGWTWYHVNDSAVALIDEATVFSNQDLKRNAYICICVKSSSLPGGPLSVATSLGGGSDEEMEFNCGDDDDWSDGEKGDALEDGTGGQDSDDDTSLYSREGGRDEDTSCADTAPADGDGNGDELGGNALQAFVGVEGMIPGTPYGGGPPSRPPPIM